MHTREKWVDFVKGVAILCVIAGHSNLGNTVTNILYFFHMPIFFIISGYLSSPQEKFRRVIIHKAKSLLYPYFIFGFLIICYNTVISFYKGREVKYYLYKEFAALFYGNFIWENNFQYIGVLWFLVALFSVFVIVNLLDNIAKKWRLAGYGLFLTMGGLFSYLNISNKVRLPFCFDIACVAFLFFLAGRSLYPIYKKSVLKYYAHFMILLGGVLLGFWNQEIVAYLHLYPVTHVDMLYMNYGALPIFYGSAVLISFPIFRLAEMIYRQHSYMFLEHLGKISLLLMVIHIYVLQILRVILHGWNNLSIFIITVLITILLSLFIERFLPILYRYPVKLKVR